MRRTIIAGSVIAGTLTLALAVPALGAGIGYAADLGSGVTTCDGTGTAAGTGGRWGSATTDGTGRGGRGQGGMAGRGQGGAGQGGMAGRGPGGAGQGGMGQGGMAGRGQGGAVTTGTLSEEQRAQLVAMAEEEKLAGDLYAVLGEMFTDAELTTIAASEDRHLASVQRLLARYGIADPTAGKGVGEFASTQVKELYDRLLARGDDSREAAYQVGVEVEEMDIADLTKALVGLTAPDVTRVYTNLRAASQHHLATFSS